MTPKLLCVLTPFSEAQGQIVGWDEVNHAKIDGMKCFQEPRKLPQGTLPTIFKRPDWAEKSFILFCPVGEQSSRHFCAFCMREKFLFKRARLHSTKFKYFLVFGANLYIKLEALIFNGDAVTCIVTSHCVLDTQTRQLTSNFDSKRLHDAAKCI